MLMYESNEYRASKDWPYAIAAGCVVYKTQGKKVEVLLLTRDFDHDAYSAGNTDQPSYHLSKGHVNLNETLEDAAKRETEEELGAKVSITGYLGSLHHDFNHPRNRNTTDKTIHYFAAEWIDDVKKTDNEHDGREWVLLDEAIKLLGVPNPKGEDEVIKRLRVLLDITNGNARD